MLSSRIDAINDDIKLVVETIMNKRTAVRGTYEKAKVAKCSSKYGVLCTVRHYVKTWLDCPLKKGTFEAGRVGIIAKFQM